MEYTEYYQRVKILAKKNGTTIEAVVNEAGLTLGNYNRYRTLGNYPRADEAFKIAKTLHTTVEYLVSGDDPEPLTADDTLSGIETLIKKYRKDK
jgi:transcriptional regulator with XRE-family HTH domain